MDQVWLIPLAPLVAAGVIALLPRGCRRVAPALAIGSMGFALIWACWILLGVTAGPQGAVARHVQNFVWFQAGADPLRLGWLVDPLSALMGVMVCFVSLVIFIYSLGYMRQDPNRVRFFGFLALFGGAMLGLVYANSLLLLFVSWELVGLASYLLIGFWFHKPEAAAAAKKAFITTRIGDLGLFLGMLWLGAETGTFLFYDAGRGCLESEALAAMSGRAVMGGVTVAAAVGLLSFWGAVGKSGQLPLHVWLPDAMEGPTPVSALIHAATMVAAGVFLMARVYPLLAAGVAGPDVPTLVLTVITWIGVLTAVFAALIAIAQDDIKRILAYSTVSQLGFMMMGLGVGGVAVAMFHLITHAFFKALLFLGAGSVIHGCHEEQDIRRMGGVGRLMPWTFATYAAGMMALCGVPLVFSGFWSKDGILHAAHGWSASSVPFWLGLAGAGLTAFYMMRQLCMVFGGAYRGSGKKVHESPWVMTGPLVVLAVPAVVLGWLGTPAWPWFQAFLEGRAVRADWGALLEGSFLGLAVGSSAVVATGLLAGWMLYGRRPLRRSEEKDVLAVRYPALYRVLREKFYVDECYQATVIPAQSAVGRWANGLDRYLWDVCVAMVASVAAGLSWMSRWLDEYGFNGGWDEACRRLKQWGATMARIQNGEVQGYLRILGVGLVALLLLLGWGCAPS